MRYFLDIAYKGTNYHGWQIQKNAHTVQTEFENALFKLFRTPIETVASGRTDKGVHASQQIIQLDLNEPLTDNHIFRLNGLLPYDIAINEYFPVKETAHARFDASLRGYEYKIQRRKNPFLRHQAYLFDFPIDLEKMNSAAVLLLQHHDFEAFSRVHTDVKTFLCDIYFARWKEKKHELVFEIEANRFLRGMVRALVGTLLLVGTGKLSVEEFNQIILSKNRAKAGASAPPDGLYLCKVVYPDSIYLE